MMHSRRNFLKKSSMASIMLMAVPQFIIPKAAAAKSKFYKNLKPLKEFTGIDSSNEVENIIFNRASSATYYGSNGLLRYAEQNLLSYSQDFTSSSWSKTGSVITVSRDIAAPDGISQSMVLTEMSSAKYRFLSREVSVVQGIAHTFSVYLKAGNRSGAGLTLTNPESYTGGSPKINVDLAKGSVSSQTPNVLNASVTDAGRGWWRVAITATPDLGSLSGCSIAIIDTGSAYNFVKGSVNYIYLWGAQLESASSASGYHPTGTTPFSEKRYNHDPNTLSLKGLMVEPAATNILKQSEKLTDTSIWLFRNVIVQPDRFVSPDGITNAIKLVEDTTSNAHYIRPSIKPTVIAGQIYTFSVFIKAGERKWAYFNLEGATVHFDLIAGTVTRNVNPAYISTDVQTIGNGWFRFSATIAAAKTSMDTGIGLEAADNVRQYSGSGTDGIYIWGPQLEEGYFATSYIPTGNVAVTRSVETCSLLAPSASSANDIMIQRTNGGTWIDNIASVYKVPNSRYELQTGSFWELGTPNYEKEEISATLFPANYVNAGFSTAKQNIFGNDYRVQSPNKTYSVNIAKNKTCQQYKFQLNSGEQWVSDAGKDKERSELYSLGKMPFNQDVWLSYAIRIAPGSPVTSKFCHIGQFHATEDSGETASVPILTFRFSGENALSITTAANTAPIATTNTTGVVRYNGILPRGEWVRNVMRIRFSPTNGQLQWWENGVEKLNLSGVGIGNNDAIGPYWKFGIYRTRSVETLIAEYANMELSTTTSLATRITNPLLIV